MKQEFESRGFFVLRGLLSDAAYRALVADLQHAPPTEPHGIHNPGTQPAEYLAVEFHGDSRQPVAVT